MPLKATSVRLDDKTLARVGEMAKAMDRPGAWADGRSHQAVCCSRRVVYPRGGKRSESR